MFTGLVSKAQTIAGLISDWNESWGKLNQRGGSLQQGHFETVRGGLHSPESFGSSFGTDAAKAKATLPILVPDKSEGLNTANNDKMFKGQWFLEKKLWRWPMVFRKRPNGQQPMVFRKWPMVANGLGLEHVDT